MTNEERLKFNTANAERFKTIYRVKIKRPGAEEFPRRGAAFRQAYSASRPCRSTRPLTCCGSSPRSAPPASTAMRQPDR